MREMQTRFGARRMGFVWVVMEPLSIIAIVLAFHAVMGSTPIQGFDAIMYMVNGIVPFHMMRSIAWRLTDAIQGNQGLFSYRQVIPFDSFCARALVEICTYTCAYVVICAFLGIWFSHDVFIYNPIAWLWAISIGVFCSISLGILFGIITHAFPGMGKACRLSYIVLYISGGIIFPIWRIPESKLIFMAWNPYTAIIDSIRRASFEYYPVTSGLNYNYPIYFSLITMFVALMGYRYRRQALRVAAI